MGHFKMFSLLLFVADSCHTQPVIESNLIIPSTSSSSSLSTSSLTISPLAMAANCSQTRFLPGQILIAAALFGLVPKDCTPVSEERLRRATEGLTCSEAKSCSIHGSGLLQTVGSVATEAACHSLCGLRGDCKDYTWYDQSTAMAGFCFLFSKCGDQSDCEGCVSGPLNCPEPEPSVPVQDCSSLKASPPNDGYLECKILPNGEEECHLQCNPGFTNSGSSLLSCSGPPAPPLRCEPAVLLVTGGQNALQQVEVYSTSSASCRHSMASLPSLYSDHSLTSSNGHVLLCKLSLRGSQECLEMSKDTLKWQKQPKSVDPRSHHARLVPRGKFGLLLYLLGRSDSSHMPFPEVDGVQVPDDACSARLSSNQYLVSGGRDCPTCAFLYNSDSDTWTRVGDLAEGRSSHGCTSYSSPEPGQKDKLRVLVAGGWSSGNLASAEVFDSSSMIWRSVGSLTGPRRGLALETIEGGQVVAVGGRHATALPAVDIFDPALETWRAGPTLGQKRAYHAVAAVPASLLGCHL